MRCLWRASKALCIACGERGRCMWEGLLLSNLSPLLQVFKSIAKATDCNETESSGSVPDATIPRTKAHGCLACRCVQEQVMEFFASEVCCRTHWTSLVKKAKNNLPWFPYPKDRFQKLWGCHPDPWLRDSQSYTQSCSIFSCDTRYMLHDS